MPFSFMLCMLGQVTYPSLQNVALINKWPVKKLQSNISKWCVITRKACTKI